jgi:hypothetical protein
LKKLKAGKIKIVILEREMGTSVIFGHLNKKNLARLSRKTVLLRSKLRRTSNSKPQEDPPSLNLRRGKRLRPENDISPKCINFKMLSL